MLFRSVSQSRYPDMMAAGVRNTANGGLIRGTARLAAEATKEAVEELPQTVIESMNRNMAQDKPLLDNVGHDATLAMAAAVATAGGMNAASLPGSMADSAKNAADIAKSKLPKGKAEALKQLTDPTSETFNPSAAYIQLQEQANSTNPEKADEANKTIQQLINDSKQLVDHSPAFLCLNYLYLSLILECLLLG